MDKDIRGLPTTGKSNQEVDNRLLSIIIPCYNDHAHITTAVKSALQQTWPNKEILIVDDGSSTRTKKVLEELRSKSIKLITQTNQGPSAARNRGIDLANGRFIVVLDSDDYFEPTFAEKAIEIFDSKKNIKIVTSFVKWFDNSKDEIFKPSGGELRDYLVRNGAMGSCMFSKQDWKNAGGYDEKMKNGFEDWEFYIRLHKDGGITYVIPEVLFYYRNTPNSRNKRANLKKYELEEYIYLKHAELYKKYFETFISYYLKRSKQLDQQIEKKMRSMEYQIGAAILSPFRWIRNVVK